MIGATLAARRVYDRAVTRPLVVGIGRIGVCLTGIAPDLSSHDGPRRVHELAAASLSVAPGVAVAVQAAASLGCAGRVAGIIATDTMGRLARAQLAEAQLDISQLQPWGLISPCQVIAGDRGGRQLVLDHPGLESEEPRPTLDAAATLGGASALLCDGSWPAIQVAAARLARHRGLPVVVDLSEVTDESVELIGLADVLLAGERVAAELAPHGEVADALVELSRLGPRAVVLTQGAAGAVGLHGDTLVECPAYPVEVIDPTGAGSVYCGAFAAALLSNQPLARCMEFAGAAAALSCTSLGAWDTAPRRDEVVTMVRGRG